jgi:hypothetical protein
MTIAGAAVGSLSLTPSSPSLQMLRGRLLSAATRLMMPPVAIMARRPTAWRGALLAARCSSGDGEQGEMRWMPFIDLSLGYAASIFATPVYASGSDADDSDAAADEPGGESRADFVSAGARSRRRS